MRTYELIKDDFGTMVKATEGEKVIWIPTNESNRHYAEYLRYTAWVEAGNNPEDFWTQTDEFDTSVSEVSQPKEKETTEQPSSTDTKIETDLGE